MQLFSGTEDCCGCTACMNICPKGAISMLPDNMGFLYPKTDPKMCVNCGLCKKVCPLQNEAKISDNLPEPYVYAVKHIYDDIRMKSSSGGMFTAVSDYVIDLGGIVYGAAFDENFKVCHQRAETKDERDRFRGSKYVQSDLKQVFQQVKTDLSMDRNVLFSGTPCQTAGLLNYLIITGANVNKLFLCDIVCHGTPSPVIFQQYLSNLKKTYGSDLSSFSFRYKQAGFGTQTVGVTFQNKKSFISSADEDAFYHLFSIILRDSCNKCPFTNFHRPSDITIGDFWGLEKSMPDFEDPKGISLVLVNTKKGRQIFDAVKFSLDYRPSNIHSCIQDNLQHPTAPSPKREAFWADYKERGYEYITKKYADAGFKGNVKKYIKRIMKSVGVYRYIKLLLKRN